MALQELQLKISGMTCGHCATSVSDSLKGLDGMDRVIVDHRIGLATIRFDNARLSIDAIKEAVNESEIYAVTEVILP